VAAAPPAARYYQSQGRDVARRAAPVPKKVIRSAGRAVKAPHRPSPPPRQPTRTQLRSTRAQGRYYGSQGRAVRRAAKVQQTLGPGHAVQLKRHDPILHQKDIEKVQRSVPFQTQARAKSYGSQAKDVAKRAEPKFVEGKHGVKIPAAYVKKNWKEAGFKKAGLADKLAELPLRAVGNAPSDVKEIATTLPSSLAHIVSEQAKAVGKSAKEGSPKPLLKAQWELGKETLKPYKELATHPVKFIGEKPVSAALMVAPTGKVPLRVAGKGARLAGKQSLRHETATLGGTTIKEHRQAGRGVVKTGRELIQKKHQEHKGPAVTDAELKRRVDEHYDWQQQHKQAAVTEAIRDERRKIKQLPKVERKALGKQGRREQIGERESGARGGAHQHVEREFAKEFGSHWQVQHQPPRKGRQSKPVIVKPKNPEEGGGVIHADRSDAKLVADAVPFDAKVIELEGATPGETSGFAVVPTTAARRLQQHKNVGKGGFAGGPVLRTLGRTFRKTVLPLSAKWLLGQGTEAAVRAAAQGAGPLSFVRGRKVMRELEKIDPAAAKQLRKRAVHGGQFGSTGAVGHDLIFDASKAGKTLAEEFTDVGSHTLERGAQLATNIGAKAPAKVLRGGYRAYTDFVFNQVNGRIEHAAKTAMLGKAVKQGPLMERRMVTLSDKAAKEAAEGLRGTASQVELARAVDRAYGRYSKFSPAQRDYILHSTPFIPWYRNMLEFLFRVMPEDHPVKTSLAVSLSASQEDWRKKQKLSTKAPHVPSFMLGGAPATDLPKALTGSDRKGRTVPLGRYGPFLPGEWATALGGQYTPFLQSSLQNLSGVDWTGEPFKGKKGGEVEQSRLAAIAALSLAEATIPGVGLANRTTGLGDRYLKGKDKPSVVQGKSIPQALLDTINPARPVGASEKTSKKRKTKKKRKAGPLPLSGGGGGGGGGGSKLLPLS